jgi:hypothetical protein
VGFTVEYWTSPSLSSSTHVGGMYTGDEDLEKSAKLEGRFEFADGGSRMRLGNDQPRTQLYGSVYCRW